MNTHFIFPASPLDSRKIDETFQPQADALKAAGFGVSVFNVEARRIQPPVPKGATAVYRGWMMTMPEYAFFYGAMLGMGVNLLTSVEQYLAAHYLPNWYPLLERWTPQTTIFPFNGSFGRSLKEAAVPIEEYIKSMQGLHLLTGHGDGSEWKKFQLKDYVKSLKTAGGSAVTSVEEVIPALENMEKFRGMIEGGICVRQWENFYPNSEKRYFIINGKPYGQEFSFDIRALNILINVARIIPSPFYSVDIAHRTDDRFRVVEIGDGQVSDLVGWTPERFAEIWK